MPLTPLAARYDHFILDLDGCVWIGGEPTPGVVEALDGAARGGQAASRSRPTTPLESGEDLVAQLWKIGLQASLRRRRHGRRRDAAPARRDPHRAAPPS